MGVLIAVLALGFAPSGLTYEAVCSQPRGEWHKVAGVDAMHDTDGVHLLFHRDSEIVPHKGWYEWVDRGGTVGPRGAAYLCFDVDPRQVHLYAAKDWKDWRFENKAAFRAWKGRQVEEARKHMNASAKGGINTGWSGWFGGARQWAGSGPDSPTKIGQDCPPNPRGGGPAPPQGDQLWIAGGALVCPLAAVLVLKKKGVI